MTTNRKATGPLRGGEIEQALELIGCEIPFAVTAPDLLEDKWYGGCEALLVCNSEPSTVSGSHWFALYLDGGGYGECFDSLGEHPEKYDMRCARFMDRHCPGGWVYNNVELQRPGTAVCGHYCIAYALCRNNGYSMMAAVRGLSYSRDWEIGRCVYDIVTERAGSQWRTYRGYR